MCYSTPIFAELQVKIGNDTTFCSDNLWTGVPPAQLGTDLVITGGIPPYKYAWSAEINLFDLFFLTASDFLNDTTLSTPTFKEDYALWQNWGTFTLTVTDAENNTAVDSINVRFSAFGIIPGYIVLRPNIGDEVLLSSIPKRHTGKYVFN